MARGRSLLPEQLPKHLVKRDADDPYRSLVWKLKPGEAWIKGKSPAVPFLNFTGARWFEGGKPWATLQLQRA